MSKARIIYGSTILEGVAANMDLRWLIGVELPDPHVFIELGEGPSDRVLLCSSLELTRANREKKNCRVESIDPYLEDNSFEGEFRGTLAFLKKHGINTVEVHPETPCALSESLREHGFNVSVGKLPWYPGRWIRTAEEISWIEDVQRKVEDVFKLVIGRLEASQILDGAVVEGGVPLTSEEMRRFIERELYLRGCMSFSTIVSSGEQAARPHEKGSGPLKARSPIVFDIYPRSIETGRFADMTRTVCKGKPDAQVSWMYSVLLDAQELGISMIRDGVDGRDVHRAISEYIDRKGFKTNPREGSGFIHGTGHSLNLRFHEPPGIGSAQCNLKRGMIVTVEPGLYYPDREVGMRIEDLVVVEGSGCRNLTRCRKDRDSFVVL